jgi:ribosomal protein S18 acetylase RimI-like enzyme
MPLTFRDARRADIAQILQFSFDGAAAPGMVPPPEPDNPGTLAAFDAIRNDPNHRLVVAEQDGEIVGTIQVSFLPGLANNGLWRGQLENVHVRADKRGLGLGGEMVQWAVARCRERGCAVVQLTSNKLRTNAHRFYERLGFQKTHEGFKLKF